jgi:hypothetical protein
VFHVLENFTGELPTVTKALVVKTSTVKGHDEVGAYLKEG